MCVCVFQKSDPNSEKDSCSKDVKVRSSCWGHVSMPLGPLDTNNAVMFKPKLSDGGEAFNLLDSDSGEQQEGDRRGRVRAEAADRLVMV